MLGTKKEDEKAVAKRIAALGSNKPQRIGNYDVQFDESTPLAARQAFAQKPVRPTAQIDRFNAQQRVPAPSSTPRQQTIAPPKTMGDMLRYNRERQMQKQQADIVAQQAKTGIAAFEAQSQAQRRNQQSALEADQNRITEQKYGQDYELGTTGNTIARERIAGLANEGDKDRAQKQRELESGQALREAQLNQLNQQTESAKAQAQSDYYPNIVKQRQAEAQLKYMNQPDDPQAQAQYYASMLQAPATRKDQAEAERKMLELKRKFFEPHQQSNYDINELEQKWQAFINPAPGPTNPQGFRKPTNYKDDLLNY